MPRQVAIVGERLDVIFDRIAACPGCLGRFTDGHASMFAGGLQNLDR
jgi:hypothetical protein